MQLLHDYNMDYRSMIIQSMVDISSSGEALVKPKTRGRGEGGGRDGGGGALV